MDCVFGFGSGVVLGDLLSLPCPAVGSCLEWPQLLHRDVFVPIRMRSAPTVCAGVLEF